MTHDHGLLWYVVYAYALAMNLFGGFVTLQTVPPEALSEARRGL